MLFRFHSGVLRKVVPLWLVVCFAGCYAPFNVLARANTGNCCPGHVSCCRKHAGYQTSGGMSWTAGVKCAPSCGLPAGVSGHRSLLIASAAAASGFAEQPSEPYSARPARRVALTFFPASLYQRPPPCPF